VAGHLEQENPFIQFQQPNSFSLICVADRVRFLKGADIVAVFQKEGLRAVGTSVLSCYIKEVS